MKSGTIIIAVVVGYIGFEAYAIKRAGHRTKPDYIHALLVRASTAMEQCGQVDASLEDRFARSLERNLERYRDDLADQLENQLADQLADQPVDKQSDESSDAIEAAIATTTETAMSDVQQELASGGCDPQTIKNHLRRYDIYARKSR